MKKYAVINNWLDNQNKIMCNLTLEQVKDHLEKCIIHCSDRTKIEMTQVVENFTTKKVPGLEFAASQNWSLVNWFN